MPKARARSGEVPPTVTIPMSNLSLAQPQPFPDESRFNAAAASPKPRGPDVPLSFRADN